MIKNKMPTVLYIKLLQIPGDCQILENIGTILKNIVFPILKNIDKYRKILKMKMPISQKLFLIQKI